MLGFRNSRACTVHDCIVASSVQHTLHFYKLCCTLHYTLYSTLHCPLHCPLKSTLQCSVFSDSPATPVILFPLCLDQSRIYCRHQATLDIAYCTVRSVQFTVYALYYTGNSVHCSLYTVHCTLYTVHCPMYTLCCKL